MRILWITNIVFPEAQMLLKGHGELNASGGWMLGAADALLRNVDIQLSVASVSLDVKDLVVLKGRQITYYLLPYGKGNKQINKDYEIHFAHIKDILKPDLIHIHGTEFSHGLSYVNACGNKNVVVSIQGIKSVIADYYYAGLSYGTILKSITLRDILRKTIYNERNEFKKSGKYEIELLGKVNHIIGRTCWDRAHTWSINPDAEYHFCNETLRHEFYDNSCWNYEQCKKYSIFLSQGSYPIKGLHIVLRAMPLILKHYPNTTIRIAGNDVTQPKKKFGLSMLSGYGNIIKQLIKRNGLQDKVHFVGNINAEDMKKEYLQANVFICPSSIENSPNSLGEAQILGTPCIASYVGGIPDMMIGNEDNLYRFEDVEMLAEKVCKIFSLAEKQIDMRIIASHRHNSIINSNRLLEIYKSIIS